MTQTTDERKQAILELLNLGAKTLYLTEEDNFEKSGIHIDPSNHSLLDLHNEAFITLKRIDVDEGPGKENKFQISITLWKRPENDEEVENPITVTKTFEGILDIKSSLHEVPILVNARTLLKRDESLGDFQMGILSAVIAESSILRVEKSVDGDVILTLVSQLFVQIFSERFPLEDFEKLKK